MRRPDRIASLRALCRCLGGLPPSGWAAWEEVAALAERHLLGPALWASIRDQGLASRLSGESVQRLQLAYLANVGRNLALRRQARDAVGALNAAGVEPMIIKGGLYLFDGTFSDPGARLMADLDLIVPTQQWDASVVALSAIGYRAEPGKPFLHPHELPMVAPGMHGDLELHATAGSTRVEEVLRTAELWEESVPVPVEGLRLRAPSPDHRVLHNVLHAQVQDLNHAVAGLPLRQLHTLFRLERSLGEQVDWVRIRRCLERHGLGGVLTCYLYSASRLFLMALPTGVSAGPRERFHHALCLASFRLGWLPDAQRNLRFALGREYIESLYGRGRGPAPLTRLRLGHLHRLWRRGGRAALADLVAARR